MSLWLQTSLSFGQAKQYVAEQANKQGSTEMLDRAGRSIQAAIQHWNSLDNWRWLLTEGTDTALQENTSAYLLPYNFKDAYLVTHTKDGSTYVLEQKDRRNYRQLADSSETTATSGFVYDLFNQGATGAIAFLPTPGASAGTFAIDYYRNMTVPCKTAVTAAIDNGSSVITLASTVGVEVGNKLYSASGFVSPPTIQYIDGNTVTLDQNATATSAALAATAGADTDKLDIPSKYQWNILAWAVHHFMVGVGAPIERMNYWQSYAARGEQDAKTENNALPEDLDISIEPDPKVQNWNRFGYRW